MLPCIFNHADMQPSTQGNCHTVKTIVKHSWSHPPQGYAGH